MTPGTTSVTTEGVVACHECDCLQREVPLEPRGVALCVRCGAELFRDKPHSLERTVALAVAALVAFLIANASPLMTLEAQGLSHSATLFQAGWALHEHGMTSLAILVFLTTIAGPLLELGAILYMLVPLLFGRVPRHLGRAFRLERFLDPWGMVEVFMLGALVSLVKLTTIAQVIPGVSLFAVGAYIVLLAAVTASFEPRQMWREARALERRAMAVPA